MRLDRWFAARYPDLPFGRLQKLLRTGQVRVDGGRVKTNTRLSVGQVVRVPPIGDAIKRRDRDPGDQAQPTPEDQSWLDSLVLYEDDDVLAINKPAGLAVQGGTKTVRHLDGLLDGLRHGASERPRLVHRLDRDTSGVLMLARSRSAAQWLGAALKRGEANKLYWALAVGVPKPPAGRIDLALAKGGAERREQMSAERTVSSHRAKSAVTDYLVLDTAGKRLSWLAMWPRTGRTHQLRAHAAAIGHPIVGDGKYGGARAHPGGAIERKLHLHARELRIPRPGTSADLLVSAPLPDHMARSWAMLGLDPDRSSDPNGLCGAPAPGFGNAPRP